MTAAEQTAKRNARIEALVTQADQWAGKLDDQDDGKKHRGRKLSDSGAKARVYHAVCEAYLFLVPGDITKPSIYDEITIKLGPFAN